MDLEDPEHVIWDCSRTACWRADWNCKKRRTFVKDIIQGTVITDFSSDTKTYACKVREVVRHVQVQICQDRLHGTRQTDECVKLVEFRNKSRSIPGRLRDFSLLQNVKAGFGAHPVSHSVGIGGKVVTAWSRPPYLHLVKWSRREADPLPPSNIQTRSRIIGAVALLPLSVFVAAQEQFFLYL